MTDIAGYYSKLDSIEKKTLELAVVYGDEASAEMRTALSKFRESLVNEMAKKKPEFERALDQIRGRNDFSGNRISR